MRWGCLGLLAVLGGTLPARANVFVPPQDLRSHTAFAGARETRLKRLLAGAYFTSWSQPDRRLPNGGGRAAFDSDPSFLLAADYFVCDRISVGGWWTPQSADADVRGIWALDGRSTHWDIHGAYHFRRGWTLQAGYSHVSERYRALTDIPSLSEPATIAVPRGTRFRDQRGSFNLWGSKSQQILGGRHPVTLYAAAGYYASGSFDSPFNLIVGGAVRLTRGISLTGSVWWYDLGGDTDTRVTVGLTGSF